MYIDTGTEADEVKELTEEQKYLRIPRRPQWVGLSAEELKDQVLPGIREMSRTVC